VPNENLKPEKNYSFDLGATYWYSQNIWIENSLYATYLTDAIVLDKATFEGKDSTNYYYYGQSLTKVPFKSAVYSQQNKQSGYVIGISTKVNVSFAKYWQIIATLNYTKGQITRSSAMPMSQIPPLFTQFSAKFNKGKYTALFTANYNSSKKIGDYGPGNTDNIIYANPTGTPAWLTLNFSAQYNITDKWHLQAGVDNILDTQYRSFGSGINAPGRNIFAALRFSWL
jgi:hemoglobin/transferrin/lactoferrin receptor protein